MNPIYGIFIIVIIAFILLYRIRRSYHWNKPAVPFPLDWRIILTQKVPFYNALSKEDKASFEYRVQEFLLNCRITGIQTEVDDRDRLLVAASAVIPVFNFPDWRYSNLSEVLLYPSEFNGKFATEGPERNILGMVGTGYMEGKMILSQSALRLGFQNESDKGNTAIHEFVHLIDKADGATDGIPELLMEKQYVIPWVDMINKNIDEIWANRSDINPYGGTNRTEFFSVVSEYFFENPKLLAKGHPELYTMLEKIFKQDMDAKKLNRSNRKIDRDDPCPCGTGKKFKKCCGAVHYNS